MKISDYEQYYQKGGTYVLPIEVFNELWGEMENWKDTCKQKDNIIEEAREYIKDITLCKNRHQKEVSATTFCDEGVKLIFQFIKEDISEILGKENK